MPFESHDWWMAGAIVAACLTLYAVSRWLYYDRRQRGIQAEINGLPPDRDYGRVRERNNTIRLSTLPELKDLEMRADMNKGARDVSVRRLSQENRLHVADASIEQGTVRGLRQGGDLSGLPQVEPADSPTNLVPFERGYAFNFSRRIR